MREKQAMRRGRLPFFLLLMACTISTLSVAFWPTIGKAEKTSRTIPMVQNESRDTTPQRCSEKQVFSSLVKPGMLEIWNTGSTKVATNTHFNPNHYATISQGKPLFIGADLDPKSLRMGQDLLTNYYYINFSMKHAAALRLISYSSHHIGKYITITLHRIVVSSPQLIYTLPGKGQFQMSPHSLSLLGINCEHP